MNRLAPVVFKGNVLCFPRRAVLEAVRALEDNHGPEVDELAASVVVVALQHGEAVPPWTLTLMISVVVRNVGRPLASKLTLALSELVENLAAVVVAEASDL